MCSKPDYFSGRPPVLFLLIAVILSLSAGSALAQTSVFTYQGRLTDGGTPANGTFDMQFKLYDLLTNGTLQGNTITNTTVQVTSGVFTVQLDFGASAFPGADRFLEINVRHPNDPAYVALAPRQQLTSTPYATRSANAASADLAINATQLGGVAANQYVQTNDARLSDPRAPTVGSSNYIQNTNATQSGSNFNISGDGTAGGSLSGNVVNATAQYNLGGARVLSTTGLNNLFAGVSAGVSNTTGDANAFFGAGAGNLNSTGDANAFFGAGAGNLNSTGDANAFFGAGAGNLNSTGSDNAFFGQGAGQRNTTAKRNSFFGQTAGFSNSTGKDNTFVGNGAGFSNTTADGNSFFGSLAGLKNTGGVDNTFVGFEAGVSNTNGVANTFVGFGAGSSNDGPGGSGGNTFVGYLAGSANTNGIFNSFFGFNAGVTTTNGSGNAFVGSSAGQSNTFGGANSFFGEISGQANINGFSNSFFGYNSGAGNTTGSNNTLVGALADVGSNNLDHATAVGADAVVFNSNTIALGRADGSDTVRVPGKLVVSSLGVAGSQSLCRNFLLNEIAPCSSSLRYKTNLAPYRSGMDVINRLRPITFDWKQGGMHDVGFGAEEVEKIDPLLVTYNDQGQVEGVKYDRISTVLVNALKEQQARIESQQHEIEALKKLVCTDHPAAELCKSN